MSINLSNLPAEEKYRVELDKQASYLVWKVKNSQGTEIEISEQRMKLTSEQHIAWFDESLAKYRQMMGV
ncbi:hypothetical protein JCM19231_5629 [Vibrio ishigakensis]|uniref:Pyridoxamine 5'-phosphate oxidase n=1 Tax=Vibrio ishigakensis TaxID=1481914 RepID=A0A0B8P962_9VIBR|nr:DUF3283 family protein [Vibrio ishigakensis]GAM59753.1 hypothetical protein JCM19231_5629 [Vibrio ishigakensis]GAM66705.1 hypothetical protein JCM19236_3035 [Vibrio sp. JCM 19236]